MSLEWSFSLLLALLLVVARAAAFLTIAPPFASRFVPMRVRMALAFALSLPVAPQLVPKVPEPELWAVAGAVLFQVVSGVVLGFITLVLFSAIQAAGELIDLFSLFSMASLLDPISNTPSSMFGRIHQVVATTLLFASGGHLLIVRGFLSSFEAMPVRPPDLGQLAQMMISNLGRMVVAALEIAGPVIVVLFCTDVALGLVSRAVPSLNIFQLSFPVKTIVTVSLAALAIALLPAALSVTVDRIVTQFQPAARLLGG
ncbi:MAG TPA: flagellar biosynthetic protein FliR [Dermatophilaceae bacterium]|nr:flagellar biosynthetic protein FliR [Dermatophilaceae bacterium]